MKPGRSSVLAPSDLARARPKARSKLSVGGRVLACPGPKALVLADALASVSVHLNQAFEGAVGDLIEVWGVWQGLEVVSAQVTASAPAPTPAGDGEFARLAWQGVGPRLVQRALALRTVRAFFEAREFLEVTTPVRVPTPALDANVNALQSERDWLITSPEHHMKRLLVGGLPRVFQLTPCFRADESGSLHEPEFAMLEWYRAFSDQTQIMRDTEELVFEVTRRLT